MKGVGTSRSQKRLELTGVSIIDTVNGVVTRETKLFCVELLDSSGDRVVIHAFGVEKISEVRSVVQLSAIKDRFSARGGKNI